MLIFLAHPSPKACQSRLMAKFTRLCALSVIFRRAALRMTKQDLPVSDPIACTLLSKERLPPPEALCEGGKKHNSMNRPLMASIAASSVTVFSYPRISTQEKPASVEGGEAQDTCPCP
jgi:hypothetical protein